MKCYKCVEPLSDSDFCLKCGADVSIYREVSKASNAYYNIGLAKAQVRDLTGAIESLKTSLMINKSNINARNLLGLIYCEMGDIVEALSEWVISKNEKPDKNIANYYITRVQSNQNKFENFTQLIKKYNQSLRYAKEGNFDVAVIQLKKIVTQSPNLLKAQLLLALLYMKDAEYNKAKKCLNMVLKVDKNNTQAQQYLREITFEEKVIQGDVTSTFLPRKKPKQIETTPLSGNDVIMPHSTYKEPSNGAVTIINILAGVVIGAALIWFLITPARYRGLTEEYNQSILNYSEKLSSGNVELNSLTKQIQDLEAERDELASKVSEITGTDGNNKLLTAVIDSANAYINNETTQAAEYLADIDVSSLPSDTAKTLYNTIAAATMTSATNDLYNQGMSYYNRSQYTQAADYLGRAYKLDSTRADLAYYCARSYVSLGNNEQAKTYYQYIVERFATSSYFAEANTFVNAH